MQCVLYEMKCVVMFRVLSHRYFSTMYHGEHDSSMSVAKFITGKSTATADL